MITSILDDEVKFKPNQHQEQISITFPSTYPYQKVSSEVLPLYKKAEDFGGSTQFKKKKSYRRINYNGEDLFVSYFFSYAGNEARLSLMKQQERYTNDVNQSIKYLPERVFIKKYPDSFAGKTTGITIQAILGIEKTTFLFTPMAKTRIVNHNEFKVLVSSFLKLFELDITRGEVKQQSSEKFFWLKRELLPKMILICDFFVDSFFEDFYRTERYDSSTNMKIYSMVYWNIEKTAETPHFSLKVYFPKSPKNNFKDASPSDSSYYPKFEMKVYPDEEEDMLFQDLLISTIATHFFRREDFVNFEGQEYYFSEDFDKISKVVVNES